MKRYKFLIKPIFFIFNLVFATWLVFKVEETWPSDQHKYETLFENKHDFKSENAKEFLKKICEDYRSGKIDSLELDSSIRHFLSNQQSLTKK